MNLEMFGNEMSKALDHIRKASDRLQKRLGGNFLHCSNPEEVTEAIHDSMDFMLIRSILDLFLNSMEKGMAAEMLKDPEKRKKLEFDTGTDGANNLDDSLLEDLFRNFGKDGDADA